MNQLCIRSPFGPDVLSHLGTGFERVMETLVQMEPVMTLHSTGKLLVMDDDPGILLSLRLALKGKYARVRTESDPERIREIVQDDPFDVVLLDMNFQQGDTSGMDGLYWLKKIRFLKPDAAVIMMTAYADIELAVNAMKEGAVDFVTKPWDEKCLLDSVETAMQRVMARRRQRQSRQQAPAARRNMESPTIDFIGKSACMNQLLHHIGRVGPSEANVLIQGEEGTGKELVARELHRLSNRSYAPFISLDLGTIPEDQIASELFGPEQGAYTDSLDDRMGRLEAANGGTLFLDGIGRLTPVVQALLLQALQRMEIPRSGSRQSVPLDIRLISATTVSLSDLVASGAFSQDLLYLINTLEVRLPSLRERAGDIQLLAEHFLAMFARKYRQPIRTLSVEAMQRLQKYSWPGNVRELQHIIEQAVILSEGPQIMPSDIRLEDQVVAVTVRNSFNLQELERSAIHQAIEKHGGNLSRAARDLGLGRTTLYRKLEKYGI